MAVQHRSVRTDPMLEVKMLRKRWASIPADAPSRGHKSAHRSYMEDTKTRPRHSGDQKNCSELDGKRTLAAVAISHKDFVKADI